MARKKTISSGLGLFTANKVQGLTENRASIVGVTAASVTGSIATNYTSSYRYDDPGNPLKSTQQLNIDWANFENHTFFNSAEAKVNMAFEQIINNYPFDGTVDELFNFEDRLTGYEKYVLGAIPQYTGFLNFNKSQFVTVQDRAGSLYPSLSRITDARAILDPGVGPFAFEMHIYVPEIVDTVSEPPANPPVAKNTYSTAGSGGANTTRQIIAQKIKVDDTVSPTEYNGITLYTEPTPSRSVTISYTGQPDDGNTLTLIDSNNVSKTYEFDPTVTNGNAIGSNVGVRIGEDADETFANLKSAVLSVAGHNGKIVVSHQDNNDDTGKIIISHSGEAGKTTKYAVIGTSTINPLRATVPETGMGTHSDIVLLATSGSVSATGRVTVKRGKWHHVSACLDRRPGRNRIEMFVDGRNQFNSSPFEIFDFNFKDEPLTIGKGKNLGAPHTLNFKGGKGLLSASIDDFRVFHSGRSESALDHEKTRKIEPRKSLRLYLTFNEPTGSYANQAVLLDHSGNSLHSRISREGGLEYDERCRKDQDSLSTKYGNPMKQEDPARYPVLFPSHPDLVEFNTKLMFSASNYDSNNPNMITKLVPDHYLREAHFNEGFGEQKELGDSEDLYGTNQDFPGGGKMGSPQIIAALLFVWAKQFDEMKLYLDQFGQLLTADYKEEDTVADTFLPFMAQYFGFDLPDMFPNVSMNQFAGKEGQGSDSVLAKHSLQKIQNTLWRRVLADVREIIRSKGTIHGIKTFMRNLGIDPDRSFRFREYGGSRSGRIGGSRQEIKEIARILSFADSLSAAAPGNVTGSLPRLVPGREKGSEVFFARPYGQPIGESGAQYGGVFQNSPLIVSPFLSGTRVESGLPRPQVTVDKFVLKGRKKYSENGKNIIRSGKHALHGVSPEPSDGLFTSGSWTCEAMYVYGGTHAIDVVQPVTQSLMRMYVTGSGMREAQSDPAVKTTERAKAAITLTAQPDDSSTIILKDNESSQTTKIFEFDATAQIEVATSANSTRVDGADFEVTHGSSAAITYTFTKSLNKDHETGTKDGSKIRINVGNQPNGIASFVSIATEIARAINSANGHGGVIIASREGRIVKLESVTTEIVSIGNPTTANAQTDILETSGAGTGGNVRVVISPRGVEHTAKNLANQIKAQSDLKITPTLLGDSKTVRLTMDTPGITNSNEYTPKIATTGLTRSSIEHFRGGFNDEYLDFTDPEGPASGYLPKTGHHGRTMLTNLVALSGSDDLQTTGSLVLFARPIPNRKPLVLALTGTDVFDGDRWNICYGRVRNDLLGTNVSSSYFLQASKAIGTRLVVSNRVEKLFDDHETSLNANNTVFNIANTPKTAAPADSITLIDDDATEKVYKFFDEAPSNTGNIDDGKVKVCINGLGSNSAIANEVVKAILSANGHGSGIKAKGSIVVPAKADAAAVADFKNQLDTDTFTLTDANGKTQLFRFRKDTDDATNGTVGLKSDANIESIAGSIRDAINNVTSLKITAEEATPAGNTFSAHTIVLEQDIAGAAGNSSFSLSDVGASIAGDTLVMNNFGATGTTPAGIAGTDAQFNVSRVDNIITVSQETDVPPRISITSPDFNIQKSGLRSAINLPAFSNLSSINRSGPFLMVGQIDDSSPSGAASDKNYGLDGIGFEVSGVKKNMFGNEDGKTRDLDAMAKTTKFGGNIAQIRFWSKALTEKEHQEHALNFKSVGVEKPASNFSFAENVSGSFEKLRLDVSVDQEVTGSDSNNAIILKDFSQNGFDMEGYAFGKEKQTVFPKTFKFSILNPNFDQSSNTNKVRVRSYLDPAVARRELVDVAPVYHIPKSEKQHDDLRFGIEISVTQALNEDIVNIFATMEEIENSLGAPESQFDVGYAGLENIRDIYFNRLTDKINISNFFQFFRWFDNTIGGTIESLVPRKTKFTGVNYIIEPHLLERPKFVYNTSDMYLGENNRHGLKGEILLRQFVVVLRRF